MKGLRIFASRIGLFLILLLAALFSVVLADAKAPAPTPAADPVEHLLLVPQAAESAIARTDARVVARYGSFTLVEATGADDRRLRAAGAQRRDDMRRVTTAAGRLDPAARPSLAGKRAPDRAEVLALVQFVGPPKDAWLARLRATGARIVAYRPENAYVVHASGPVVDRVAALVGTDTAVRAVTPLGAPDKLEGRAGGEVRYAVSTVAGTPGADARIAAAADGDPAGAPISVGSLRTQFLELAPAEVDELARDPAVVSIQRAPLPQLHDERTAQIVAGNLNAFLQPSAPGYLAWHGARFPAAFSFAIDVSDTGLDDGQDPPAHPDFYESGTTSLLDRVAYRSNYTTTDADARDCSGHGTNVASIAAGYGAGTGLGNEDAEGFKHGVGVAPVALIGASKLFDCDGDFTTSFSPAAIASTAYEDDARISNNSWGTGAPIWGSYTATSALYDQLVRDAQSGTADNQQFVEVFAAGNDGDGIPGGANEGYASIGSEASAKNVITVGASEGVRASGPDGCGTTDFQANVARDIVDFSSRGPTDDGRLKPDIVAPGTHVTGVRPPDGIFDPALFGTCTPNFAGTYSLVSGTSQAAPQVAGAAALVRDWYERNVPGLSPPSPAMTKALLINTATDLAGGDNGKGDTIAAGPNADQGWGRVNLGTTFDTTTTRQFFDQVDTFDASTDPASVRTFSVVDPGKPVKVTLVWTDAPGTPGGDAFVNNLDLDVSAGGQTYHGNVFAGASSRTGGTNDERNNVESVYLQPGLAGRFSVLVRPTAIGGNGVPNFGDATDQDFALVVSNATVQAGPVLAHEQTDVDDSGPGGDGDGFLESDEQATLTEEVRNATASSATAVSATLGGSDRVTVTQPSSTYPDIAADDVEPNDTPFGVHLANAAPCGADAAATLAITTGAETQSVPLALPTGEPGPLQSNPSAQVPVAIPDDSPAGAVSSVAIPDRGRIKDVDVTIAGITHSFVGDLVIDITGPDGTTVRLAEHPGGPDNGANNFSGTTFDDDQPQSISQGSAPYSGSFRPQNDQLSRFNGKSRQGTWTLRVRDLFEGDVGTLQGWGVGTSKAVCDIDTTPPDTTIAAAPANPTTSTTAQFTFGSDDGGATFECSIDGSAFATCPATTTFGPLSLGTHTVNARAIDGSDNQDASPVSYSWSIVSGGVPPPPPPPPPPPTPAASFVLAPAEERLADALAGRYSVIAACAGECRVTAKLAVSARTARRLGLGRRAVTLGQGAKGRNSAGTVKATVRLSRKARAALRERRTTTATLTATLSEGASRLTLRRSVSLMRAGGLRRIASNGLRLWAACRRSCPLSATLSLSAAQARRIGLRPGTAARYRLASRRIAASRTPRLLVLSVTRAARGPLRRARRVAALLDAVAGTAPNPLRRARLSTTLRR